MAKSDQAWGRLASSVLANMDGSPQDDAPVSCPEASSAAVEERCSNQETGDPITALQPCDPIACDLTTAPAWAAELRTVEDRLEQRLQRELKAVEERLLTRVDSSGKQDPESKPRLGREAVLRHSKSGGLMEEVETLKTKVTEFQDVSGALLELQKRIQALEEAHKETARALQAAQEQAISLVHDEVGCIFHQLSMDLERSVSQDHDPKSSASIKTLPGTNAERKHLESKSSNGQVQGISRDVVQDVITQRDSSLPQEPAKDEVSVAADDTSSSPEVAIPYLAVPNAAATASCERPGTSDRWPQQRVAKVTTFGDSLL